MYNLEVVEQIARRVGQDDSGYRVALSNMGIVPEHHVARLNDHRAESLAIVLGARRKTDRKG